MPDAITASFGLNLAPLKRDWAEAKRISASESAKVAAAIKEATPRALTGTIAPFGVDYAERARMERQRRNSAAGFAPARPGQYPSPMSEEATGRRRGSAPFGIIGAATAFYGVERLVHAWEGVNDQAIQLRTHIQEITKLTASPSFRTMGDIEGNLSAANDVIEQIQKRNRMEHQPVTGMGQGQLYAMGGFFMRKGRQFFTGGSDEEDAKQLAQLRKTASRDIDAMAEKQEQLNSIEEISLSGSERKAEILKEEIASRERLSALAELESKSGINNPNARIAEDRRGDIARLRINRAADLHDAESASENRIAELEKARVTNSTIINAKLRERLSLIEKELAGGVTIERRQKLAGAKLRTEAELDQNKLDISRKPFAEHIAEIQQAEQDRRDLRRLNSPGSVPGAYKRHPDAYGGMGEPVTGPMRNHLQELNNHMKMLEPGITTGTGPSADFRSMFGDDNGAGGNGQPGEADSAVVDAINNAVKQIVDLLR